MQSEDSESLVSAQELCYVLCPNVGYVIFAEPKLSEFMARSNRVTKDFDDFISTIASFEIERKDPIIPCHDLGENLVSSIWDRLIVVNAKVQ